MIERWLSSYGTRQYRQLEDKYATKEKMMMLNPGIQFMARAAQGTWWKIAARKGAEAAVKIAKSEAARKAAGIAAEQGTRKILEKKKNGNQSLGKRLKKLDKMLKKGSLRAEEYETLRKRIIEETAAADL